MAFIRIKNIKNNKYAYLVENTWTNKGTRQKVKAYLGKVLDLKLINQLDFDEFISKFKLKNTTPKETIINLIQWELYRHGFKQGTKDKKPCWKYDKITAFPEDGLINIKKRNIVLNINDNFMCNHTLNAILNFSSDSDQEEVAFELAEAFVIAGIQIPKEVFINIYQKIHKKDRTRVK